MTDKRTILVFEEPAVKGFKAGLGTVFGAAADKPVEPRLKIDFATVDIDALASMNDNISVPHASIEKLTIGKGIGGYGIWMVYLNENGKKDYLLADLTPPPELVKKRKAEGVSAKEVRRQYSLRCQEVFRKALPPLISEKVEWKA